MRFLALFFSAIILSGCGYKFKINYDFLSKPKPQAQLQKKVRVALVLGGGGAKCISQLGVISVLEKNNIPIDLIIGTSGGSIAGALYADNPNATELKTEYFSFKQADLISFSLLSGLSGTRSMRSSIINGENGEKFLKKNMSAKNFEQLKIPFVAVTTDISTGETFPISTGPIAPAVRASYSIPGLFAPVRLYGRTLVDGGVTAPLAIDVAKQYHPDIIIAIDVSTQVNKKEVSNMLDLTYKSLSITYSTLTKVLGKEADVLIKPKVGEIGIFDDHRREELYQAGVEAGYKAIPEIKKKLENIKK